MGIQTKNRLDGFSLIKSYPNTMLYTRMINDVSVINSRTGKKCHFEFISKKGHCVNLQTDPKEKQPRYFLFDHDISYDRIKATGILDDKLSSSVNWQ